MYCPTCNTILPDDAKFCGKCGTIISEARSAQPAPAAMPAAAPEYRAADPSLSAPPKFSPKSLVSMILGIAGVVLLNIAAIVMLSALSGNIYNYYYASRVLGSFVLALSFSAVSLGLGITALVLSGANTDVSKSGLAFRKVGKITGIIGVIVSGIVLTTTLILVIIVAGAASR